MSLYQTLSREAADCVAAAKQNPDRAPELLKAVKARRREVCEGHYHGNPCCPCLVFLNAEDTLVSMLAASGGENP